MASTIKLGEGMEQVTKLLEQLASKLGTTIEHLWGILIRQARISAIQDFFIAGLSLIIIILLLAYTRKLYKWVSNDDDYGDRQFIWIPYSIIMTISVVLFFACCIGGTTALFNPEYYALKQVLSIFNK